MVHAVIKVQPTNRLTQPHLLSLNDLERMK